jgi:hypothetical protein
MCRITQENKLGQRFIGASDFLKSGIPASILATFVCLTCLCLAPLLNLADHRNYRLRDYEGYRVSGVCRFNSDKLICAIRRL